MITPMMILWVYLNNHYVLAALCYAVLGACAVLAVHVTTELSRS